MHTYPYTAVVTVIAVLIYWITTMMVGKARQTHKIEAPSCDGPPEFQRAFRAQMNTLEQIVIFLPLLWLFAGAWGDLIAAGVGVFWPIGRFLYARGYAIDAKKRGPGFLIGMLTTFVLFVGAIAGLVQRLAFA